MRIARSCTALLLRARCHSDRQTDGRTDGQATFQYAYRICGPRKNKNTNNSSEPSFWSRSIKGRKTIKL